MIISRAYPINGVLQHLYVNLHSTSGAQGNHHPRRTQGTLLFIHGGPGWADAPWAGVICKTLWQDWNTVHWDQRGCNRSHALPPHPLATPLTIDQLVADGLEVCRLLNTEFKIENPVLIGHSWGAFLATLMAARAPELFSAYVGVGQLVSNRESEPLSLEICKRNARLRAQAPAQSPNSATQKPQALALLAELNAMPAEFYRSIPTLFRQREIVYELGGEFHKTPAPKDLENWILQSPEGYRSNWTTLHQGCESTCLQLWPELIERSLFTEVRRLELPVTIAQGKHDACTPSEPVVRWLDTLECTHPKELVWFEDSAHWPQIEESEKFARLLDRHALS